MGWWNHFPILQQNKTRNIIEEVVKMNHTWMPLLSIFINSLTCLPVLSSYKWFIVFYLCAAVIMSLIATQNHSHVETVMNWYCSGGCGIWLWILFKNSVIISISNECLQDTVTECICIYAQTCLNYYVLLLSLSLIYIISRLIFPLYLLLFSFFPLSNLHSLNKLLIFVFFSSPVCLLP